MERVGMRAKIWLTAGLLGLVLALLASLLCVQQRATAQATVSEGQTDKLIAIAASHADGNLLYLIDTTREVILVYGFSSPGTVTSRELRNGSFQFLAGRLYRWDLLLASKREYSISGFQNRRGLPPQGPGSSEEQYKHAGE
jgi:hypothetical protein